MGCERAISTSFNFCNCAVSGTLRSFLRRLRLVSSVRICLISVVYSCEPSVSTTARLLLTRRSAEMVHGKSSCTCAHVRSRLLSGEARSKLSMRNCTMSIFLARCLSVSWMLCAVDSATVGRAGSDWVSVGRVISCETCGCCGCCGG